ncbi:MAG TPA: 50S ribosomal protein L1 [Firmicutes bacterium]|nr:50S ribosomal protein L1 [Bacillota bacterium]HAW99791.1 50S ribosomal protein L1 [Bacillota bacterium]
MKQSKKYAASLALIEKGKAYSLTEAVALVKKTATTKFDGTIDISFNLNIDTKQADQQLRGTIVLPHSNGKTKKILAITNKTEEATAAGADYVGGKEMLQKIQSENWFDFDVIVATPDMMGELGRMGRILGPKGLMPNPKAGTVSPDIASAIKEIKAGKIEYRADKEGNMHLSVAKASFADDVIVDNLKAVIDTVLRIRPASVKGVYIKNAVIHSVMGPSVKIAL